MNEKMIRVAVSGARGRLGSAVSEGVAAAADLELVSLYDPGHAGESVAGVPVSGNSNEISAGVMVECTHADDVMGNLKTWHAMGLHVVVGTSGFSESRLVELRSFWRPDAAPYFDSVEIIERHQDKKPDAPSGTALATAMRIGQHRDDSGKPAGTELIEGVRGGLASGVRVHSLRMKGLLSDQEVAFSNSGETFSVHHRSTSYDSFVQGALLAIRRVVDMKGVSIGLDALLGVDE